jgi:hypothetical protein
VLWDFVLLPRLLPAKSTELSFPRSFLFSRKMTWQMACNRDEVSSSSSVVWLVWRLINVVRKKSTHEKVVDGQIKTNCMAKI